MHLYMYCIQCMYNVLYKCGLRPRSVVEMCVTMDSAIGSVLPKFRSL